jgi:methionine--tRNA ligase beta chain
LFSSVSAKFEKTKKSFESLSIKKIEEENVRLRKDVASLKDYLCELERKSGVTLYETNIPQKKTEAKVIEPIDEKAKRTAPTEENTKKAQVNKDAKKEKAAEKPKKTTEVSGSEEIDVGRLDLRVGRILEAKKHPDADALYVETIDLGEEKPRTVVSGLVRFVPLEQMQNRLVVCLCNLKPAKMRGVESQAMVMCASTPDKVEIMEVDPSCTPGQPVFCSKYAHRPDPVLNPKKKIWEGVAPDLKVSADGKAVYKDEVLLVDGKSPMTAPTLRSVPVK